MSIPLDESCNRAWRLFLTAHRMVVEQIEQALDQAELPPLAWYDVLWSLEQAPGHRLRLHELAQQLLHSRSNLTRLADRLEAVGFICRERCPSDRRGAFAVLTPAGQAMRQRMWPLYAEGIQTYFADHLTAEEVAVLSQALERVLKAQPDLKASVPSESV